MVRGPFGAGRALPSLGYLCTDVGGRPKKMGDEGEKKKRTFKKYSFRGIDLDKLLDLSNQDLMELFSRACAKRDPTVTPGVQGPGRTQPHQEGPTTGPSPMASPPACTRRSHPRVRGEAQTRFVQLRVTIANFHF